MVLLISEMGDIKAAIACINFALSNAAKYGVEGEILNSELQQLGLPKGKLKSRFFIYFCKAENKFLHLFL